MGFGKTARFLCAFPAALRRSRLRLRLYADARNENWNLERTFLGAGAPLTDLKVRRMAAGVESAFHCESPLELEHRRGNCHRNFRNLSGHTSPAERPFFSGATSVVDGWVSFERCCACRSVVSRSILPPKRGPAASLLTLSGRSPGSADRFARIGFAREG